VPQEVSQSNCKLNKEFPYSFRSPSATRSNPEHDRAGNIKQGKYVLVRRARGFCNIFSSEKSQLVYQQCRDFPET
jgi:hypothetical protein